MNIRRIAMLLCSVILVVTSCAYADISFSENPDAIEAAALSIFCLTTYNNFNDPIMQGSGFLLFDNITLITNYHVIEGATTIKAESDDNYQYSVTKVLIADKEKDLAILQFMAPTVMLPLDISCTPIKRGEKVVTIGSPIGLKNSVSFGNVSNVYFEDNINWIQFTAPISHGSSGGALFNDEGKVIGITSASFSNGQNINLAISVNEVLELWRKWDGTSYSISDYILSHTDKTHIPTPTVKPAPSPTSTPIRINTPRPTPTPKVSTNKKTTNLPSKIHLIMKVGETKNLGADYYSNLSQNLNSLIFLWTSNNDRGLKVSAEGKATAILRGVYTITASTPSGKAVTFYITVINNK